MYWLYALLGLAMLAGARAFALDSRFRGNHRKGVPYLLSASLLLALLWSACGGGGTPHHDAGTQAGNYTLSVTATDASASTLAHTIGLSLTVD